MGEMLLKCPRLWEAIVLSLTLPLILSLLWQVSTSWAAGTIPWLSPSSMTSVTLFITPRLSSLASAPSLWPSPGWPCVPSTTSTPSPSAAASEDRPTARRSRGEPVSLLPSASPPTAPRAARLRRGLRGGRRGTAAEPCWPFCVAGKKTAVFSLIRMDGTFNPHGILLVNYFLFLSPPSFIPSLELGPVNSPYVPQYSIVFATHTPASI